VIVLVGRLRDKDRGRESEARRTAFGGRYTIINAVGVDQQQKVGRRGRKGVGPQQRSPAREYSKDMRRGGHHVRKNLQMSKLASWGLSAI
jgi:hypothetical protein